MTKLDHPKRPRQCNALAPPLLLARLSAWRRIELAGAPQIGIHARLPPCPGRAICADDIGVEPQLDLPLRPFRRRPAPPLTADREYSICQLLFGQFGRFFVFV